MILDGASILAYLFGLVLLFLFAWLFIKPLKWLLRLGINSLIGGVLLFDVNLLGGILGITVSVNALTALFVGILGVPGLVLLYIMQLILQ